MTRTTDRTTPSRPPGPPPLVLCGLAALGSSAMMLFSMPGYELWWLSWVSLVPLLWVLEQPGTRRVVLTWWLAGFLYFLPAVAWLHHLTPVGWVLLAFYLSWSFPVFALLVRGVLRGRPRPPFVVAVPVLWVVVELLRGLPLGGFCWHYVGHNLYRQTALIQVADFAGVYGVSFVVVTANAVIARLVHAASVRGAARGVTTAGAVIHLLYARARVVGTCVYGVWRIDQTRPIAGPRISVVQGNIPQELKEYAKKYSWEEVLQRREQIYNTYRDLTLPLREVRDDLVVWPETIVPPLEGERYVDGDCSTVVEGKVRALQAILGRPLLVGSTRFVVNDADASVRSYNGAYFFPAADQPFQAYFKIHLVPFGEYIPFRSIGVVKAAVEWFMPPGYVADLSAGSEVVLFEVKGVPFAAPICYEDTKPLLIRQFRREGAAFVLNLTNDGWFRDTVELDQHLANSLFRAVENRVGLVRSTNTGISAFITPTGVITSLLSEPHTGRFREVAGVLTDGVVLDARDTFYTRYGDAPIWTLMGCTGVWMVVQGVWRRLGGVRPK